jgi:two-component system response regulator YesN
MILKGVKLVQERYWDRVSLSELARELGISKFMLSRRFRQVMGVTFRAYLLRLRLEKAKALLATGGFSITEVAQMVGFGDLPRLDKLFKRYAGVTPSAYRDRELVSDNKE